MDPQQCFLGGEYSKKSVWDAVVENAKSRPHVDCEHLEGEQFIKAIAEYVSHFLLLGDVLWFCGSGRIFSQRWNS
jgi:hypothetical protein